MRNLRGPSLPVILLALVLGIGLLLPEVAHSLAHHDAAYHHGAPHSAPHHDDHASPELAGEHHGGDHLHLELVAVPSGKPSLFHAAILRAVVLSLHVVGEERRVPSPLTGGQPPGRQDHGPPPPSRAPPLV
jgi:hypothetical protein